MPLDRTWYNTLVDDDGSGLTGSLWDKADVDALMDAIDARLAVTEGGTAGEVLTSNGAGVDPTFQAAASGAPVVQSTTATGAQNDFALSDGAVVHVRCTGAAPVFSGFVPAGGHVAGMRVILTCLGTSVKVLKETLSTAANQIITPSNAGQIVGVNGTIELVYDGVTSRWRITAVTPGAPITVAHAAGNFTAASGTWTVDVGDQLVFQFSQRGTEVLLELNINNSSVSATPTGLKVELAATIGFTVVGRLFLSATEGDNGVLSFGTADFNSAVSYALFSKISGTWATSTNNTSVSGSWIMRVQ